MSLDRYANAIEEFRGLYRSLQETHSPFDVVPAEAIADMGGRGGLSRYVLLVLPDIGPLAPAAAAALDRFVGDGGRLVLTGRSGFDADGRAQLACMPASCILAETTDADALKSVYVAERAPEEGRRYFAPVCPIYGTHLKVKPRADAVGGMVFLPQAAYGPPEKAYGHRPDGTPGHWVDGARRVALVPWTIGRSYQELGLASLRDVFVGLVRELMATERQLEADLPEQVEMTCSSTGRTLSSTSSICRASGAPTGGRTCATAGGSASGSEGARRIHHRPRRSSPAPPVRPPAMAATSSSSCPISSASRSCSSNRTPAASDGPNDASQATAQGNARTIGSVLATRSVRAARVDQLRRRHLRPRNSSTAPPTDPQPPSRKALQSGGRRGARRRPRRSLRRRAEPQMGALRSLRAHALRAGGRVREGADRHRARPAVRRRP